MLPWARPGRGGSKLLTAYSGMNGLPGPRPSHRTRARPRHRHRLSPTRPNTPRRCKTAPFRDTVESQLQGDRRTYQLDSGNGREGLARSASNLGRGRRHRDGEARPAVPRRAISADVSTVPVWAYSGLGRVDGRLDRRPPRSKRLIDSDRRSKLEALHLDLASRGRRRPCSAPPPIDLSRRELYHMTPFISGVTPYHQPSSP